MAVPSLTLNINHYMGLVFSIIGWVIGWYSLVLITAEASQNTFPKKPTNSQWYGIIFAVAIAVMGWFQRILAVQGEEQEDA